MTDMERLGIEFPELDSGTIVLHRGRRSGVSKHPAKRIDPPGLHATTGEETSGSVKSRRPIFRRKKIPSIRRYVFYIQFNTFMLFTCMDQKQDPFSHPNTDEITPHPKSTCPTPAQLAPRRAPESPWERELPSCHPHLSGSCRRAIRVWVG